MPGVASRKAWDQGEAVRLYLVSLFHKKMRVLQEVKCRSIS